MTGGLHRRGDEGENGEDAPQAEMPNGFGIDSPGLSRRAKPTWVPDILLAQIPG